VIIYQLNFNEGKSEKLTSALLFCQIPNYLPCMKKNQNSSPQTVFGIKQYEGT